MKKQSSFSIHEAAPEMLLEKIAEFKGILAKHKSKGTPSANMKFYEDFLKVMQFAFSYMMDTKHIHERNLMLESNVRFLAQLNDDLQKRLDEIHTIQRLQCQGRLDEVIEQAEHYTDYVMSVKHK